jgi:hypothetical protein
MLRYLGKRLFPNEQRSAQQRKMQILCVTILGALLASALLAGFFYYVYSSGRW